MNKLIFALFTIGLLLITYFVWTSYESPSTYPGVVERDPIPKPLNPDEKMTSDKSDDKTKAERDEALKKEYELNIKN